MRIKSILYGLVCFVLILLFFSQSIFSTVAAKNNNDDVTIAGISINAEKESDIQALVATAINEWKMEPLIVQGETAVIKIDSKHIHFDVTKAVEQFIEKVKNPWYKPWSKATPIDIPLEVTLDEEVELALKNAPLFKVEETMEAIRNHASLLKKTEVAAKEMQLSKESLKRTSFEIHEVSGNHSQVSSLANELNEFTLKPGETFSFLNAFEADQLTDSDSVNFFASVLYSVVLQADISIVERHSQHTLPNYLQHGIEAEVSDKLHRDFAFQNDSQFPMMFSSAVENNQLLIELYTLENDMSFTYSVSKKEVEPRTIYRLSSTVRPGAEKVLQEGSNGFQVTVSKKSVDHANGHESEEQVSRDFYPPQHKIVLVSSDKPNDTQANEDVENHEGKSEEIEEADVETQQKVNTSKEVERDNGEPEEIPAEEVIYDKGGNVINDKIDE